MEHQHIHLSNGLRIHLTTAGSPNRPPLVLLHGYPSSNQLWRNCIPGLADRFRVYAPDLPGHGESDKPAEINYDLNFWVQFLSELFDELRLDRTILIAHDLGGMAALGFVSRYQHRVTRFVIMDTAPYADWPKLLAVMVDRARRPLFAHLFLTPFIFKWILKTYLVCQKDAITNEVAKLYRTPWAETSMGRKAFSQVMQPKPAELAEPPENLRKIQVPTLILWGEKDRILPVKFARRLHEDLSNSQLKVIPNCGHFLQEEEPDLVVDHILSFLKTDMLKKTG